MLATTVRSLKLQLVLCCIVFITVLQFWWIFTLKCEDNNNDSVTLYTSSQVDQLENGYGKQLDPFLTDFIYQRWIVGPSEKEVGLSLREPSTVDPSQVGQAIFVDNLLNHKTGGFFVECGAANGETFSNSLYLERFKSWTGLLVEANPVYFKEILRTNRKVFSINSCLSTINKTQKVEFKPAGLFGGLEPNMDDTHMKAIHNHPKGYETIHVQCFTLASVLLSIKQTHVDYFSLDVEGAEIEILHTIPWDRIYIDIISVEYRSSDGRSIDQEKTKEKLMKVRQLFKQIGLYKEVGILPWGSHDNAEKEESRGLDVFFKHI